MDGSFAVLTRAIPGMVSPGRLPGKPAGGILYIDDFDAEEIPRGQPPAAPQEVSFTQADLAACREEGRQAGLEEARLDIAAVQAQLRLAALQSLADAAGQARGDVQRIAEQHARDLAATILAVLSACLPAACARHATGELDAIFQLLLPGLRCEPELRVRVHPDLHAHVEATLAKLLGDMPVAAIVRADPALAPSDVALAWRDGTATRCSAALWAHVADALAPLALPSLEEITRGH